MRLSSKKEIDSLFAGQVLLQMVRSVCFIVLLSGKGMERLPAAW
jgi:hypothetical protein